MANIWERTTDGIELLATLLIISIYPKVAVFLFSSYIRQNYKNYIHIFHLASTRSARMPT